MLRRLLCALALILAAAQAHAGSPTLAVVGLDRTQSPVPFCLVAGNPAACGATIGTLSAGGVWTPAGALLPGNNLADVPNKAAARASLQLGGAATLNVGTVAGTVAAADNPLIVGAVQSVATEAALEALLPVLVAPPPITRLGFHSPGDGPAVTYSYTSAACSAPDKGMQVPAVTGGCWIAALDRVMDVRVFGAMGTGATGDILAIQAAVNAASGTTPGVVVFPPGPAGGCYLIDGTVAIISAGLHVDLGDACLYVTVDGPAFEVLNSYGATLSGGFVFGDNVTASSQLFQADNSPEFTYRDSRVERIGLVGTINGGFYHRINRIRMRNLVTSAFVFDQYGSVAGEDAQVDGLTYDTDGVTPREPTGPFLDVRNFEAITLTNYDLIHASQVATMFIHPIVISIDQWQNRSGDHLIGPGFWDIKPNVPSILVNPAPGARSDRVNVFGAWFATGTNALSFTGSGYIEDWNVRNSYIYNNSGNAVEWTNTSTLPSTITFAGNKFSGNCGSNGGSAVYSDIAILGTSPVNVSVDWNIFNDAGTLTTIRCTHNVAKTNPNANLSINANDWTFSGATGSHTSP